MNRVKPITIYDITELVEKVFLKAFSISNIQNGFEVSGFFLVDENIFEKDKLQLK